MNAVTARRKWSYMSKGQYNPYNDVLEILENAARMLGLDKRDYIALEYP
jgi:hypothetical protein